MSAARATVVGLLLVLAAAAPALGDARLSGEVEPGSKGHEVEVAVRNTTDRPSRDVRLTVLRQPAPLTNVRIEPPRIAVLAPGASATFVVRFDVSGDAPLGAASTSASASR